MSQENHSHDGHHLILGELTDYITGKRIPDTHDERYRQKISHLLVDTLGFDKKSIAKSEKYLIQANNKKAELKLDFLVTIEKKALMLIRYAPGSIVSRRQSTTAWSRIVRPYQIPVAVTTNGEDAEIIDGFTGNVITTGLNNIPPKSKLDILQKNGTSDKLPDKIRHMALRIIYAIDVDGSCSCDTDICRLD